MQLNTSASDASGFQGVRNREAKVNFTYSVTLDTNDFEAILRKIEYWHQGSIAAFRIMYRDETGVWGGVRWDGQHPAFFAIGETDEKKARQKLRGMEAEQGD